jgi:hypothetical protein
MANVKFVELPTLTTMTDASVIPTSDGTTTKQITGLDLKDYMNKTKEITHAANITVISPEGQTFGSGSSIAITDNYHTEKILLSNELSQQGRATLPNVSVYGKTVILVTTTADKEGSPPLLVDVNIWGGQTGLTISNSSNGLKILMSLGSNGWKQIQTND